MIKKVFIWVSLKKLLMPLRVTSRYIKIGRLLNIINKIAIYSVDRLLKLAKEEATLFFEDENPLLISQQLSKRPDVIITDGKNPVAWYINGSQGITETPTSQKIVDTTGAGDAFLAGLLSAGLALLQQREDFLQLSSGIFFQTCCLSHLNLLK